MEERDKKIECQRHTVFLSTHPNANRFQRCLTSVIRRELYVIYSVFKAFFKA